MSEMLRILIVDDMMTNIRILESILNRSQFETAYATDGKIALEMLAQKQYHCILLDIVMPGISGFDLISLLKDEPKYAEIPVIFITGDDAEGSSLRGFALGAVDYITKPFYPQEVLARVKVHTKLYWTIQTLATAQADILLQIERAQSSLLDSSSDLPEAHFSVLYRSLHAAGGDLYEIIEMASDRYGYFVGDFAGHSISSCFLTSSVKALLRQNCTEHVTPVESIKMVNSVLCQVMHNNQYLTACYADVNRKTRHMSVVNIGHPPLLFIPVTGEPVCELGRGGDILGLFKNAVYEEIVQEILPGDRILMYTDGLIEGKQVWSTVTESFRQLVEELRYYDRERFLNEIFDRTDLHRDGIEDDIMILVADIPGEPIEMEIISDDFTVICIAVPSSLRFCTLLTQKVIEFLSRHKKISSEEMESVSVALCEAVRNAILHGNRQEIQRKVLVDVSWDSDGSVIIGITDEGFGFDREKELSVEKLCLESNTCSSGFALINKQGFVITTNERGNKIYLWRQMVN